MLFSLTLNNSKAAYILLNTTTHKGEGAALHHPLLCETEKENFSSIPELNVGSSGNTMEFIRNCWQTSKYPSLYSLHLTASKVSPALDISAPGAQHLP